MRPYFIYRTANGWIVTRQSLYSFHGSFVRDRDRAAAMHSFDCTDELLRWLDDELSSEQPAPFPLAVEGNAGVKPL